MIESQKVLTLYHGKKTISVRKISLNNRPKFVMWYHIILFGKNIITTTTFLWYIFHKFMAEKNTVSVCLKCGQWKQTQAHRENSSLGHASSIPILSPPFILSILRNLPHYAELYKLSVECYYNTIITLFDDCEIFIYTGALLYILNNFLAKTCTVSKNSKSKIHFQTYLSWWLDAFADTKVDNKPSK